MAGKSDAPATGRRGILLLAGAVLAAQAWSGRSIAAAGTGPRPLVDLQITTNGDLLEFSTRALACRAGTRVRLTFVNGAKYVNFEHNWVLIRPGTFDAVVAAAEQAGEEHGWLPVAHPAVIAATGMAHKGQSVQVEFDAPPAGRYLYICTMPGHPASMWGVFTVGT